MFSIVERFGLSRRYHTQSCMYSLTSTFIFTVIYFISYLTEIGRISDALMSRGGKSFVSCLVGARLILIVHIN